MDCLVPSDPQDRPEQRVTEEIPVRTEPLVPLDGMEILDPKDRSVHLETKVQ